MLCQMRLKADDRLNTTVCCRPDASLARISCPRLQHVENVWLCPPCQRAIVYCEPCFDLDRQLVRSSLMLIPAGSR